MTKKELIAEIESAYTDVVLGNGVGYLESQAIDEYAGNEERKRYRDMDERFNWKKLLNDVILGYSCLNYTDDVGFRFLLPACLISSFSKDTIMGPVVYLITVGDTRSLEKYAILNTEQRRAVRHYL